MKKYVLSDMIDKFNNKKYNVISEKDKKLILKINNIINNGDDFDDEKPYRILALFRTASD